MQQRGANGIGTCCNAENRVPGCLTIKVAILCQQRFLKRLFGRIEDAHASTAPLCATNRSRFATSGGIGRARRHVRRQAHFIPDAPAHGPLREVWRMRKRRAERDELRLTSGETSIATCRIGNSLRKYRATQQVLFPVAY
jgi:hypothetical protein